MKGKGNQSEKGTNGDLLVKVKVKPSEQFKRDGSDILSDWYISVSEAVLGGNATIKTIHGKQKI